MFRKVRLAWLCALAFMGCFSCGKAQRLLEDKPETNRPPNNPRELQFENVSVKVWKTTVDSKLPLKLHRHDSPRILVGLKGGTLLKEEQDGTRSLLHFETGKAYWLDADPPGTLHSDRNESPIPVEVMVIELKAPSTP